MPARHARQRPRSSRESALLAQEAARLLATHEAAHVDAARRKAAQRLRIDNPALWPSDEEIRSALDDYLNLFSAGRSRANRRRMLQASEQALQFLVAFDPVIALDSIESAADDSAAVELLVFCDEPEAVLRFLDEHHIAYDQRRRWLHATGDHRHPRIAVDALGFRAGDTDFVLLPLPSDAQRWPLATHPDGPPLRRLGLAELRRRLAAVD